MPRSLRPFLIALTLLLGGLFLSSSAVLAAPQINNQINYQARLMDSSGFPVADGNYSVIFSLYDASTAGNRLWTAAGTLVTPTAITVNVQNGLFTVLLGDTGQNTLDTVNWNSDQLYLGVTINADAEMLPRKRFASAPQAFNARQLQGMYASSTASGGQTLFTINQTENNAATSTRTALTVRSSGTSNANDFLIEGVNDLNESVFSLNRQGTVSSTRIRLQDGSLSAPAVSFSSSPDSGLFYDSAASAIEFSINNSVEFYLDTNNLYLAGGLVPLVSGGSIGALGNAWNDAFFTGTVSTTGLLVDSKNVCLVDGTNCPTAGSDTLQSVTARGSFTTTTVQFFGGLSASTITATGTTSLQSTTATNLASTGLLSFLAATGSTLNANIASFATATVAGQGICLSNGQFCSTGSTPEADTLQTVSNRGSFTTTTLALFGGLTASNITATGTLNVTGASTLNGLTFTNATGTNTTSTNLFATNLFSTNLLSATGTITNFNFTHATGSSLSLLTASSSNLFANFGQFTSATVAGQGICLQNGVGCPSGTVLSDTLQSVTARGSFTTTTAQFFGGLTASNITATGSTSLQNTTATNLASTGLLSFTNATGSTLIANFASFASATVAGQGICLQNGVGCPSATAEADTLASVTNRGAFATSSVTLFGGLTASNISATGTLNVNGNSSLTGLTFTNATGVNATTTGRLSFNIATGTSLLANALTFGSGVGGSLNITTALTVNGINVCLQDNTNCPVSGGSSNDGNWVFNSSTQQLYQVTSTLDLLVGGTTQASSPFVFLNNSTDSRFLVGAGTALADVVIGATTAAAVNAEFQLSGNDLFVAGNIGSASSVYSSGEFVAGETGPTVFGDGYVRQPDGALLVTANASLVQPSISIVAGDRASGLAGDVNITAGNGLAGSPAGNINFTPGDSLGQPGHVYLRPITGSSNTPQFRFASVGGGYISLESPSTSNSINFILPFDDGASSTVIGTDGNGALTFVSVCLTDGTNCPTATSTETLQSVTARGSFTTTTAQFFGGFVAASSSVTGTLRVIGSSIVNGTSTVTGSSSFNGVDFVRATGTAVTSTNLFASSLGFTTATGTTFNTNSLTATTGSINLLNFANATSNYLLSATVSTTNLFVGGINVCLANGTNCSTAGLDTLQSVTVRGSFTTTTAQFFGGFVAASSSVTGTLNVAGSANLLQNAYVGTSTYTGGLHSEFAVNGNDLFVAGNIGSVSSVYTNGAFIAGSGSTYYGDGYVSTTQQAMTFKAGVGYLFTASSSLLSVFAYDGTQINAYKGPGGGGGDIDLNAAFAPGGSNYVGGNIGIDAGAGDGTGDGGVLSLTSGDGGSTGQGGDLTIISGDGTNGAGGNVSIAVGTGSSTASGGSLALSSGPNLSALGVGGDLSLTAGFGVIAGGNINILAGSSDSVGGDVTIQTGDGAGGNGVIRFRGPASSGDQTVLAIYEGATAAGDDAISIIGPTDLASSYSFSLPNAIGASGTAMVLNSVGGLNFLSVCLSDGTNCSAGSGSETLQSVTARGSFTTTTAQFFGGFVAASSSVTGTLNVAGTFNVTGTSRLNGSLIVTASSSLAGYTFTQATGTNLTLTGTSTFNYASGSSLALMQPTSLVNVSSIATTGTAYKVEVVNGFAYVAATTGGLHVFDVHNPASPRYVTSTHTTGGSATWIKVSGQYAYVGYDSSGFVIYDISEPAYPRSIGAVDGSICAQAVSIEVFGNYIYAACSSSGFLIFDVSAPSVPRLVSTFATGGLTTYSAIQGKYAYVIDLNFGLRIIDITVPENPAQRGFYTDTSLGNIAVQGAYAYIARGTGSVEVINVASSSNPTLFGSVALPAGIVWGLDVAGNYLYAGNFAEGIFSIDITNPALPRIVGNYDSDVGGDTVRGVKVVGKYAYIAEGAALRIVDLQGADISAARIGALQAGQADITNDAVVGNQLYVKNGAQIGQGGIFSQGGIVTATGTTSTFLGNVMVGTSTYNNSLHSLFRMNGDDLLVGGNIGAASSVFTNGAFVAGAGSTWFGDGFVSSTRGISMKALAGAISMETYGSGNITLDPVVGLSGTIQLGGTAADSVDFVGFVGSNINPFFSGIYSLGLESSRWNAYLGNVTATNATLTQLYVSSTFSSSELTVNSPSSTFRLSGIDVGNTQAVDVQGKFAYIGDNSGQIDVLDISNYEFPQRLGQATATALVQDLKVDGKYLYAAINTGGLQIFDVSDPRAPVSVGSYNTAGTALSVAISGRYAYVADGLTSDGLAVIDVSNPRFPVKVGRNTSATDANQVVVQGQYAYVADGGNGLRIFDISSPTSPVLRGTFNTPDDNVGLYVAGRYAYLVDGLNGDFFIVDVASSTNPTQVGTLSFSGLGNNPTHVTVAGDFAYVGGGSRLVMLNVASSTNPTLVSIVTPSNVATAIDFDGRALLLGLSSDGLAIYDVFGATIHAADIGSLRAGSLHVTESGRIGQALTIGDSLSVGGSFSAYGPSFFNASSASSVVSIINTSSGTQAWGAYINTLLVGDRNATGSGADDYSLFVSASSETAVVRIQNTHSSTASPFTAWGLMVDSIAVTNFNVSPAISDAFAMYLDYSSGTNRGGICIDDLTTGGGCPITGVGGRSILTDGSITTNAFDLAERYAISGSAEGGDLLVLDAAASSTVTKHAGNAYDSKLIGIASVNPGFELGFPNASGTDIAVALTGRVPTKISTNNGTIEVGDPLTSSDVPGYAMKATKPGMIVGYALDNVSVTGTHEVFVNVGYWAGSVLATDGTITTINDDITITASAPATVLNQASDSWGLTFSGEAWDASSTSVVASSFTLLTDIMNATTSRFTIRSTSGTDLFAIDQEGNATIAGDLSVGGKLFPSSKGGGMQSDWYVFVDDTSSTAAYISTNANGWQSMDTYDFAERYYSPDELEPGDLVVVSDTGRTHVQRSMNETAMVLGIVSTRPAFIAGRPATSTYPIALSGRVPTKVSGMNGAIKAGDPLAPTSIPGVAAKAIHTGPIVGLALEDYDQTNVGSIEVFVNPGWWTNQAETNQETIINNTVINNVTAGVMRRGVGMIAAGSKRVHISFDSIGAYPFVQVTPRGLIQGNWGTDGYSDTGFDILLSAEQTFDTYFSWQVEPLQGSDRLNLSDGTSADIDPVTGLPFGFTTPTTTEPIIEEPPMTTSTEALPGSESTSTDSVTEPTESETSPTSTEEILGE